ncbi:MAG: YdcF family protein [Stellaceae bacterium]|jgi:uncharacterized SAM-binding protein YcdF (DUF218 family)
MEFFNIAKIAEFIVPPSNLAFLAIVVALLLPFTRFRRTSRLVGVIVGAAAAAIFFLPIGQWVSRPLENRFPHPDWPACIDGIVVLGGGGQPRISATREQPVYRTGEGAIVAGVELLRRYPEARLVFSGGSADFPGPGIPEADVAKAIFDQLGVDPARVGYESRSRDTWENLVFTQRMVQPKPDETWVLVTTAQHMPRAMGIARRLDWRMLPWPTDYRTPGDDAPFVRRFEFGANLSDLDEAAHEWLGLAAYYLAGKTDALFPAPENAPPLPPTCRAPPSAPSR